MHMANNFLELLGPDLVKFTKVTLLLKTNGYFTDWHWDSTDPPVIIILEQVEGETVVFSAPGSIGLYYSARRYQGRLLHGSYFEEFLGNKRKNAEMTEAIPKAYRHSCLLRPGERCIVPVNCLHEAHVPKDTVEKRSTVLAFLFQFHKSLLPEEKFKPLTFKPSKSKVKRTRYVVHDDGKKKTKKKYLNEGPVRELLRLKIDDLVKQFASLGNLNLKLVVTRKEDEEEQEQQDDQAKNKRKRN